jgi:hypothetical protein
LDWRRAEFTVTKFAGVKIRRAARREEEDEVGKEVKEWKSYRAWGYL